MVMGLQVEAEGRGSNSGLRKTFQKRSQTLKGGCGFIGRKEGWLSMQRKWNEQGGGRGGLTRRRLGKVTNVCEVFHFSSVYKEQCVI